MTTTPITATERAAEIQRIRESGMFYTHACDKLNRLAAERLGDYVPAAPPPPPTPAELKLAQLQREADYHKNEARRCFLELHERLHEPPDPFQNPLALLEATHDPDIAQKIAEEYLADGLWSAEEAEAFRELLECDANLELHQPA